MPITTTSQTIVVDDVSDVVVTDPAQDGDGNWVREVRIAQPTGNGGSNVQVFVLRLVASAQRSDIEITTPQLQV